MTFTEEQVHKMCSKLRECDDCPREVLKPYGAGTRGCYLIAEETLEFAAQIISERTTDRETE